MQGIKVQLDQQSVSQTKTAFNTLLTQLQEKANNTVVKVDIDIKNVRSASAEITSLTRDLKNLSSQIKQSVDVGKSLRDLTKQLEDLKKAGNTGNNSNNKNFGLGDLTEWLLIRKGIQEVFNELRSGFQFINDMNKAMTEISVVTGQSQAQVAGLAKEYNNLAKSMGVTTEEVAKASVEYYRQGLSQNEVMQRMKTTTEYAKVSSLDFQKSAEILTATVNSMGIDINRASDVFTYLGDATATGADEIGRAFQKVGGTASALGVDFEKVSSWIATISSKTREGAETIGNSLKNVMARYQQMREKGFAEEDGTQVNQVSKALAQVNIDIIDAKGNFKNFGDIMDTLGGKWSSLTNRQQAYIATTLAGTNQQSRFLNLMNNYSESVQLYEQSLNSAGTTQNKFNLWLQGTEAKMNQLKSASESLWLHLFDSNAVNSAIGGLTSLVETIDSAVQKFGAIPTMLGTVGLALGVFSNKFSAINFSVNSDYSRSWQIFGQNLGAVSQKYRQLVFEQQQLQMQTQGLSGAYLSFGQKASLAFQALSGATLRQIALNATLRVGMMALNMGIGILVGTVVSKAITAFEKWKNKAEDLKKANEDLLNTSRQNMQTNNNNIKSLEGLSNEYDALTQKTTLTSDEQKRLHDIQNQIAQISPDVVGGYDEQGNAVLNLKNGVQGLTDALKEKNKVEQLKLAGNYDNAFQQYTDDAKKARDEINKLQNEMKGYKEGYTTKDSKYLSSEHFGTDALKQHLANLNPTTDSEEYRKTADQIKSLEDASQKAGNAIEIQRSKLKEAEQTLIPYKTALLTTRDGYDNLSDSSKNLATQLVSGMELNKNSSTEMSNLVKTLNDVNSQKAVSEIKTWQEQLNNGTVTSQQFKIKIEELEKNLYSLYQKAGGSLGKEAFSKLFDGIIENADKASNSMKNMEVSIDKLQESLSSNLDNIEKYGKMLNEIKDKGVLSSTSKKEIITKDPTLIPYLSDTNKLTQELTRRINEMKVQSEGAYSAVQIKEQGDSLQKLLDTYNTLSSAESLSTDQKALLASTIEQLKGQISGLDIEIDNNGKITKSNIEIANDKLDTLKLEEKYLGLVAEVGVDKAKSMMESEKAQTLETIKQVEIRLEARKKDFKSLKEQADSAMALAKTPDEIAKARTLTDSAMKGFNDIVGDEVDLEKLQEKASSYANLDKAIAEADKVRSKSGKELGGVINNLTADTNESTKKNKQAEAQIKALTNALKSYENQMKELDNVIKGYDLSLSEMYEGSDEYLKTLDDKQKALESELNLTNSTIDANQAKADSMRDLADSINDVTTATTNNESHTNEVQDLGVSVGSSSIPSQVLRYKNQLASAGAKYGINDIGLLMAIMSQESGGTLADVMQASEGAGYTITDPTDSIDKGVKEFARDYKQANGNIPLALQAYNYGSGFIGYANKRGGYSQETAQAFANSQGGNYGDPQYVAHVLRYYNGDASSIDTSANNLASSAESFVSKFESIKDKKLTTKQQLDEVIGQRYKAILNRYKTEMQDIDYKANMDKADMEEWTPDSTGYMMAEWDSGKQINNKYSVLNQQAEYIKSAMASGNFNDNQLQQMKKDLQDVQVEMANASGELKKFFGEFYDKKYTRLTNDITTQNDLIKEQMSYYEKLDDKKVYGKQIENSDTLIKNMERLKNVTGLFLQSLKDDYNKEQFASTKLVIQKSIDEYEQRYAQIQQQSEDAITQKWSTISSQYQKQLKDVDDAIKGVNDDINLLQSDKDGDQTKQLDYQRNLLNLESEKVARLNDSVQALMKQRDALQYNSDEWNKVNDLVKDYTSQLKQAEQVVNETNQKIKDTTNNFEQMSNNLVSQISEALQKQKKKDEISTELENWKRDDSAYAKSKVKELTLQLEQLQSPNKYENKAIDMIKNGDQSAIDKLLEDNSNEFQIGYKLLGESFKKQYEKEINDNISQLGKFQDAIKKITDAITIIVSNTHEQQLAMQAIATNPAYKDAIIKFDPNAGGMFTMDANGNKTAITNIAEQLGLQTKLYVNNAVDKAIAEEAIKNNSKYKNASIVYVTDPSQYADAQASDVLVGNAGTMFSNGKTANVTGANRADTAYQMVGKATVFATGADKAILKAQYGDSINIIDNGTDDPNMMGKNRDETNKRYQEYLSGLGVQVKDNSVNNWDYNIDGSVGTNSNVTKDGDVTANSNNMANSHNTTNNTNITNNTTNSSGAITGGGVVSGGKTIVNTYTDSAGTHDVWSDGSITTRPKNGTIAGGGGSIGGNSTPVIHATGANAEILRQQYGDKIQVVEDRDDKAGSDRYETSKQWDSVLSNLGISKNKDLTKDQMYSIGGNYSGGSTGSSGGGTTHSSGGGGGSTGSSGGNSSGGGGTGGGSTNTSKGMSGTEYADKAYSEGSRVDYGDSSAKITHKDGTTETVDYNKKYAKGGETQKTGIHWLDGELGRPERVLTTEQTMAFNDLVYGLLPKLQTLMIPNFNLLNVGQMLNRQQPISMTEPLIKNDIQIVNNTPFDVSNNMDNLNRAIKSEVRTAGYRLNFIG